MPTYPLCRVPDHWQIDRCRIYFDARSVNLDQVLDCANVRAARQKLETAEDALEKAITDDDQASVTLVTSEEALACDESTVAAVQSASRAAEQATIARRGRERALALAREGLAQANSAQAKVMLDAHLARLASVGDLVAPSVERIAALTAELAQISTVLAGVRNKHDVSRLAIAALEEAAGVPLGNALPAPNSQLQTLVACLQAAIMQLRAPSGE